MDELLIILRVVQCGILALAILFWYLYKSSGDEIVRDFMIKRGGAKVVKGLCTDYVEDWDPELRRIKMHTFSSTITVRTDSKQPDTGVPYAIHSSHLPYRNPVGSIITGVIYYDPMLRITEFAMYRNYYGKTIVCGVLFIILLIIKYALFGVLI